MTWKTSGLRTIHSVVSSVWLLLLGVFKFVCVFQWVMTTFPHVELWQPIATLSLFSCAKLFRRHLQLKHLIPLFTELNRPHFPPCPKWKVFPEHTNFNLINWKVNCYLASLSSKPLFPTTFSSIHITQKKSALNLWRLHSNLSASRAL